MCICLNLCRCVMLNSFSYPFTIITMSCTSYHTRPSWSWSRGSWIYNYLCKQCISPLTLRVRILLRRPLDTALCDKVCQWLVTGQWFSPGTPVSFTNKTDRHDMTEIVLKVTLNTITLTPSYHTIIAYLNICENSMLVSLCGMQTVLLSI